MLHDKILSRILEINMFLNEKDVIIFGAGSVGIITAYVLKTLNIKVLFFADNDKTKNGKVKMDIQIKSPNEINLYHNNNTIILIASMYYKQIDSQLSNMGFVNNVNYYNIIYEDNISSKDKILPNWF